MGCGGPIKNQTMNLAGSPLYLEGSNCAVGTTPHIVSGTTPSMPNASLVRFVNHVVRQRKVTG